MLRRSSTSWIFSVTSTDSSLEPVPVGAFQKLPEGIKPFAGPAQPLQAAPQLIASPLQIYPGIVVAGPESEILRFVGRRQGP